MKESISKFIKDWRYILNDSDLETVTVILVKAVEQEQKNRMEEMFEDLKDNIYGELGELKGK
jgi:hypothetical protein